MTRFAEAWETMEGRMNAARKSRGPVIKDTDEQVVFLEMVAQGTWLASEPEEALEVMRAKAAPLLAHGIMQGAQPSDIALGILIAGALAGALGAEVDDDG